MTLICTGTAEYLGAAGRSRTTKIEVHKHIGGYSFIDIGTPDQFGLHTTIVEGDKLVFDGTSVKYGNGQWRIYSLDIPQ
jgi:hypothetical protein